MAPLKFCLLVWIGMLLTMDIKAQQRPQLNPYTLQYLKQLLARSGYSQRGNTHPQVNIPANLKIKALSLNPNIKTQTKYNVKPISVNPQLVKALYGSTFLKPSTGSLDPGRYSYAQVTNSPNSQSKSSSLNPLLAAVPNLGSLLYQYAKRQEITQKQSPVTSLNQNLYKMFGNMAYGPMPKPSSYPSRANQMPSYKPQSSIASSNYAQNPKQTGNYGQAVSSASNPYYRNPAQTSGSQYNPKPQQPAYHQAQHNTKPQQPTYQHTKPQQPAYQQAQHSSYQPVKQPGYSPHQSSPPKQQSVYQPPRQTYTQPASQAYTQPAQQTYKQPASQTYSQPARQTYSQPSQQGYQQPAYKPPVRSQEIKYSPPSVETGYSGGANQGYGRPIVAVSYPKPTSQKGSYGFSDVQQKQSSSEYGSSDWHGSIHISAPTDGYDTPSFTGYSSPMISSSGYSQAAPSSGYGKPAQKYRKPFIGAGTTCSNVPETFCHSKKAGHYSHPNNKHCFMQCDAFGRGYDKECAPGTSWKGSGPEPAYYNMCS